MVRFYRNRESYGRCLGVREEIRKGYEVEKELFLRAWGSFRARPGVWLLLSLGSIPYLFHLYISFSDPLSSLFQVLGFIFSFALVFLLWCKAAFVYGGEESVSTLELLRGSGSLLNQQKGKFLNLSLLISALFYVALILASQIVFFIFAMLWSGGVLGGGRIIAEIMGTARDLLVAFLFSLVALAPQISVSQLEEFTVIDHPMGIIRQSFMMVKQRYRRALPLYLIPEVVSAILVFLFNYVATFLLEGTSRTPSFAMFIGIVIILLVVSALVAGGRVAFVAAAFDALFREIQEEEARKRKKKKVQIKEKSTLKSTYPGKKKK